MNIDIYICTYEYYETISHTFVAHKEAPPGALLLASPGAQRVDVSNTQYLCGVTVGTPPEHLEVILDTGSADVWLRREKFDSEASSSLVDLLERSSVTYGGGALLSGELVEDVLSLGGLSFRQPCPGRSKRTAPK